jgi:ADP-L-glycero-D-manno-heptose 6-epimerase
MPDRGCYIVTGGAGFIGSNLAAALTRQDPAAEVTIIDDLRGGSYSNMVGGFERAGLAPFAGRFIAAGVESLDPAALVATRGLRAVFHLAGVEDPAAGEAEIIRSNAGLFEPLLVACVQTGMPLVYASSAAVYGVPSQASQRKPFPLDAAGRPVDAPGAGKWLMECVHARLGTRTALGTPHVVGLRYFDVFGPGESRRGGAASLVYQVGAAILAGSAPRVPTDPTVARDLVFVDDAVTATMAALGIGTSVRPRPGVYNVGSGVATSVSQVLAILRDELSVPESVLAAERVPPAPGFCGPDFTQADLSATAIGLGWKPACNPIDAVRGYARWMKAARGC